MIVKPFKPFLYNKSLENVVSPPFDTIPEDQEKALLKIPYNVSHLSRLTWSDESSYNLLKRWISDGVLVRTDEPVMIVLSQYFKHNSETFQRLGVICLTDIISEENTIKPHEDTIEAYVIQRRQLMETLKSQLEPVFLISFENQLEKTLNRLISGKLPDKIIEESTGVKNYIYIIKEEQSLLKIQDILRGKNSVIADGHHRIRASKDLFGSANSQTERDFWRYSLTYITSVYERAIKIGGIHRIVKDNKHTTASILQNISDVFRVETMNNYHSDGEIVLYDGRFNTLIPIKENIRKEFLEGNLKGLSSPFLVDYFVFRRTLNLSQEAKDSLIEYTNDVATAINSVDRKNASYAILMPGWDKEEFMNEVLAGEIMPPKSTYFYPKIPSGIAIESLL